MTCMDVGGPVQKLFHVEYYSISIYLIGILHGNSGMDPTVLNLITCQGHKPWGHIWQLLSLIKNVNFSIPQQKKPMKNHISMQTREIIPVIFSLMRGINTTTPLPKGKADIVKCTLNSKFFNVESFRLTGWWLGTICSLNCNIRFNQQTILQYQASQWARVAYWAWWPNPHQIGITAELD